MYRTQKARGFAALCSQSCHVLNGQTLLPPARMQPAGVPFAYPGIATIFPHGGVVVPSFARPCPVKPRHGFVESRPIATMGEALDVIREAFDADPEAEVIFAPKLTGRFSAVASERGFAVGLGNDGVTGGKASVFIPVPMPRARWKVRLDPHNAAGLLETGEDTTGFLETVEDNGDLRAVQVRAAPGTSGSMLDCVPEEVKVKAVVEAWQTPDLLEWEKKVKTFEPGTVVHVANILSHHAIHCIESKVPVVSSHMPKVGDVLKATAEEKKARLTADAFKRLAVYLKEMDTFDLLGIPEGAPQEKAPPGHTASPLSSPLAPYHSGLAALALGIGHARAAWGPEDHLLRLRAWGLLVLLRLTMSSVIAETRHWWAHGPGKYNVSRKSKTPWGEFVEAKYFSDFSAACGASRDVIFAETVFMPTNTVARWCRAACQDLRGPGWSTAFGGKAWRKAGLTALLLWRAVGKFMREPNGANARTVGKFWNRTLNAVHNNGPILTKWVCAPLLGVADAVPVLPFLYAPALDKVMELCGLIPERPRTVPKMGWTMAEARAFQEAEAETIYAAVAAKAPKEVEHAMHP